MLAVVVWWRTARSSNLARNIRTVVAFTFPSRRPRVGRALRATIGAYCQERVEGAVETEHMAATTPPGSRHLIGVDVVVGLSIAARITTTTNTSTFRWVSLQVSRWHKRTRLSPHSYVGSLAGRNFARNQRFLVFANLKAKVERGVAHTIVVLADQKG